MRVKQNKKKIYILFSICCLKLNALQLLTICLLSFLILNALAQNDHDEINSETVSSDTFYPSSNINELDVYSESPQLTRVARQRRPILTGAAVGVVVANNRRPYYASNYTIIRLPVTALAATATDKGKHFNYFWIMFALYQNYHHSFLSKYTHRCKSYAIYL